MSFHLDRKTFHKQKGDKERRKRVLKPSSQMDQSKSGVEIFLIFEQRAVVDDKCVPSSVGSP